MRRSDKLTEAVKTARPHIERLARDEELHAHLKNAFESTRWIYDRLLGGRGVRGLALRASRDRELQRELGKALEDLRAAGARVRPARSHSGRSASLFGVGLGLAALFNPATGPATRNWLKRKLGGSEGEMFAYRSNGQVAHRPASEPSAQSSEPERESDGSPAQPIGRETQSDESDS